MTLLDEILDIEIGALLFSMVGTLLISYLYLFSSDLRELMRSANQNFRAWTKGNWSIRTGPKWVTQATANAPPKEFE